MFFGRSGGNDNQRNQTAARHAQNRAYVAIGGLFRASPALEARSGLPTTFTPSTLHGTLQVAAFRFCHLDSSLSAGDLLNSFSTRARALFPLEVPSPVIGPEVLKVISMYSTLMVAESPIVIF